MKAPRKVANPCANCGHAEDDHDGYGGLCDGFGWNNSRMVCGCVVYKSLAGITKDDAAFLRTIANHFGEGKRRAKILDLADRVEGLSA